MKKSLLIFLALAAVIVSCHQPTTAPQPAVITAPAKNLVAGATFTNTVNHSH